MNRYEEIIVDRMVELEIDRLEMHKNPKDYAVQIGAKVNEILLLLDCIVDFREPPAGLRVEDGHGAMAVKP